jgi:hypothetical protein
VGVEMNWIILNSDKTQVDNVIVADEDFIQQHYPDAIPMTEGVVAGIGYLYENGSFIKPVRIVPEEIIDVEEVTPTLAIEN